MQWHAVAWLVAAARCGAYEPAATGYWTPVERRVGNLHLRYVLPGGVAARSAPAVQTAEHRARRAERTQHYILHPAVHCCGVVALSQGHIRIVEVHADTNRD